MWKEQVVRLGLIGVFQWSVLIDSQSAKYICGRGASRGIARVYAFGARGQGIVW
jgi:hypothetical protein